MFRYPSLPALLVLFLLLSSPLTSTAATGKHKVLLIILDGLRPDYQGNRIKIRPEELFSLRVALGTHVDESELFPTERPLM